MKKILVCLIIIILGMVFKINQLYSQEQLLLKGKVSGTGDGSGLPGAAVVELDKNNRVVRGTTTDMDGNFALILSNRENKLQVTFIGYKTEVLEIGGRSTLNIKLEEDVTMLEGVEVFAVKRTNTGFLDIDDRDLAIPVEKMSTKDIEGVQASSIDEAIQGRLAGVDIVSNSGDPGGGMSIRIRGVNTLSPNAKPLIVVDNIPYITEIASDFDFATANEEGYSQMLSIAIDDINEITVLKDASATALWGPKAANGVLLVTTKRGGVGRKPQVSYTYRGTYSIEPDPIPLLSGDQYSTLILEAAMNVYGLPMDIQNNKEFLYDPSDPYYYYNYGQNTNWLKALQQNAFTHNHSLSLSGGGEKAAYRLSSSYEDREGTTIGTGFKNLNNRLNLDYFISDKLKLVANFAYAKGTRLSNYDKDLRAIAYRKMPNMAMYEFDEEGNMTPVYFSPVSNIQGYYNTGSGRTFNTSAMAEFGEAITKNDRIDSKFSLEYNIIKGLKYTFDVAFAVNNERFNNFLPQIASGRLWNDIYVNRSLESDNDEYTIYTNNKLSYINTFADIHEVVAVFNIQTDDWRGIYAETLTYNSASSLLTDPSVDSKVIESGKIASSRSQVRSNGVFGMIQYKFKDKYIIAGGLRRNGNSKFDKKYRYGYFPSISARWRISGEQFMKGLAFIDDLSLMASYGENGQVPEDAYGFFSNYNTFGWPYLGYTGIYPLNMQLENLKWENVITRNIGFSTELFKKRLTINLEFYSNRTDDLLGKIGISSVSGYEGIGTNLGTMDSQGWDFSFRSYPVRREKLSVSFDFNIARNYNVMREISEDYYINTFTPGNGEYVPGLQVDNPMGSFYGYRYKGVYKDEDDLIARDANNNLIYDANGTPIKMVYDFPKTNYQFQPGDAKYEDVNHDGNINYLDVVYLGDANPDFTGGFGSNIKFGNIDLMIYFHSRIGNDIVNLTQMHGENMFGYDNQTTAVLSRWRNPGDETDMPRALLNYGYNWMGSDRYVHDGSFLRLKYITLSYTLPKKITNKFGLNQLKISTTLNNMLTFTKYMGQDPEISIKSRENNIYTVGYDNSNTPRTKEITLNLNIIF